jgi:hypothetical protein
MGTGLSTFAVAGVKTDRRMTGRGKQSTDPFYDRWTRAENAERKAGMRMARTTPTTAAAAAMVNHIRCEIAAACASLGSNSS